MLSLGQGREGRVGIWGFDLFVRGREDRGGLPGGILRGAVKHVNEPGYIQYVEV